MTTEQERDAVTHEEAQPLAPCGEPGCDCGHTIEKLQKFKDWVHTYLDSKGVPYHPPGTHGAEGCRIGDRMDWLIAEMETLRRQNAELREALKPFAILAEYHDDADTWGVNAVQIDTGKYVRITGADLHRASKVLANAKETS